MLHYTGIVGLYKGVGHSLIGITVTGSIYKDVLTYTEMLQTRKYARVSIGTNDMACKYTIAFPRWISSSIQPSDLILQPGDIPIPVLMLHTDNGRLHFDHRNFQCKAR